MKTAKFTNFTKHAFTASYDSQARTFQPGQSSFMPDYLARHFAKHLVNRELLRKNMDGTLVYPHGDKMTSPKFPEQVPQFMKLFELAYTPDNDVSVEKKSAVDVEIEVANRNREVESEEKVETEVKGSIVDGEESEFGDRPKEGITQ